MSEKPLFSIRLSPPQYELMKEALRQISGCRLHGYWLEFFEREAATEFGRAISALATGSTRAHASVDAVLDRIARAQKEAANGPGA